MVQFAMTRRSFVKTAAVAGAAAAVCSSEKSPLTGLAEASKPAAESKAERIRCACRACGKMECGVWVTVKDGRAIKIEGDESAFMSGGNCCSKSLASLQAAYHPDRLKYPLKRTKPKGEDPAWVRITWDEALDTAAKKFKEIQDKYGGEALFAMAGTSRIWCMQAYGSFKPLLNTPNGNTANQICKGPRFFGTNLTHINTSSWYVLTDGVKVFTQWGAEQTISNYDDSCRTVVDRRFKADKHIVVDPRLSNFAKEADIWLPIRPGTDAAMALSWMDVIIKDKLYDETFVKRWSNGPFLYCADIDPTGWKHPGTLPLDLKTRLLKESDVKEGGSVKRFMVWDELSKGLRYFDVETGLWQDETFKKPTEFTDVPAGGRLPAYSKFDPAMSPALYGSFTVKLKSGKEAQVTPVWQLFADRCAEYSPEKAEKITTVPAAKVREAARVYASKPGNGGISYMLGIEQSANCTQNVRALAILTAITGNLDTPGGHRGGTTAPFSIPVGMIMNGPGTPALPDAQKAKILGGEKFPLLKWGAGWADGTSIWDAVHTGKPYPLKGGLCQSGDFMNMSNSLYAWEALKKLDFFFMMDLWQVPTAQMADILVPVEHWLEVQAPRTSQGSHGAAGANTGPIKPQWETKNDVEITIALCKRMGVPWGLPENPYPTLEELYDWGMEPLKMTWKQFKEKFQKEGWMDMKKFYPDDWGTYLRYETGALRPDKKPGFATATMKTEIWSTVIETYYPDQAMPLHQEPPESPVAKPELSKEYPLWMTTGRRIPTYFHSEHRQLPWCRELAIVPKLEINPATAAKLGIKQGDWVWIESPKGKVRQTADLFEGIAPNVVNAEHAWWYPEMPAPEKGFKYSLANILVNQYSQDPIIGSSCLRGYPVKVYKATEGAPEGIITSETDPRLKAWLPEQPKA